jgi:hypothetical protein
VPRCGRRSLLRCCLWLDSSGAARKGVERSHACAESLSVEHEPSPPHDERRLREGSRRVERRPSREKTLALAVGCGLSFRHVNFVAQQLYHRPQLGSIKHHPMPRILSLCWAGQAAMITAAERRWVVAERGPIASGGIELGWRLSKGGDGHLRL